MNQKLEHFLNEGAVENCGLLERTPSSWSAQTEGRPSLVWGQTNCGSPKMRFTFWTRLVSFTFFIACRYFCNFFGLLFISFVTNLLFLASLFMRNENEWFRRKQSDEERKEKNGCQVNWSDIKTWCGGTYLFRATTFFRIGELLVDGAISLRIIRKWLTYFRVVCRRYPN